MHHRFPKQNLINGPHGVAVNTTIGIVERCLSLLYVCFIHKARTIRCVYRTQHVSSTVENAFRPLRVIFLNGFSIQPASPRCPKHASCMYYTCKTTGKGNTQTEMLRKVRRVNSESIDLLYISTDLFSLRHSTDCIPSNNLNSLFAQFFFLLRIERVASKFSRNIITKKKKKRNCCEFVGSKGLDTIINWTVIEARNEESYIRLA